MAEQFTTWGQALWNITKLALEILIVDFLMCFFDGYRNARWHAMEVVRRDDWRRG